MDAAGILIAIMDILVGVMVIMIAGPLIRGEVKRNPWYGVRLSQSFESEERWREINCYGGRQLRTWASFILAAGIVALFFDLGNNQPLLVLFAFMPLLLLIPAWRTVVHARRA